MSNLTQSIPSTFIKYKNGLKIVITFKITIFTNFQLHHRFPYKKNSINLKLIWRVE